jgi:hypothetical protein
MDFQMILKEQKHERTDAQHSEPFAVATIEDK